MEVVGRFPKRNEAAEMNISEDVPVWLPVGPNQLKSDMIAKIKQTRKAANNPPNQGYHVLFFLIGLVVIGGGSRVRVYLQQYKILMFL